MSGISEGLKILPGLGMLASGLGKVASVLESGIKIGFDHNRIIEESQIGFEKLLGSVDKARAHLKELHDLNKTGIGFEEAIMGSKRLQAAGFGVREVVPIMQAIGDAARGTGAEVDSVSRALTQMTSKGRVSAEEVNQQLAEQGIPAWRYLAEAIAKVDTNFAKLSKTQQIARTQKMAERGELSGKGGAQAILLGLQREYGGQGARFAAETASGLEGQLQATAGRQIGAATKGLFEGYKDTLRAGLGSLSNDTVTGLVQGIGKGSTELLGAGKEMGGYIITGIKDSLDMHSPSQVMIGLGMNAGMSFQEGFARAIRRGGFSEEIEKLIEENARRTELDPDLLRSIMKQESGGNRKAVSNKGASGLMQLMPATARSLGVTNIFDPAENIRGGADYMAMLMKRFGGDTRKALAGYNAGPGRVDQFGGVPPPSFAKGETYNYVQKVMADYERRQAQTRLSGGSFGAPDRRAFMQKVDEGMYYVSNTGEVFEIQTEWTSGMRGVGHPMKSRERIGHVSDPHSLAGNLGGMTNAETLIKEYARRNVAFLDQSKPLTSDVTNIADFTKGRGLAMPVKVTNIADFTKGRGLAMPIDAIIEQIKKPIYEGGKFAGYDTFDPKSPQGIAEILRQSAPLFTSSALGAGEITLRLTEGVQAATQLNDVLAQTEPILMKAESATTFLGAKVQDIAGGFGNAFSSAFSTLEDGFKGVASRMVLVWAQSVAEMILQAQAAKLTAALFGGFDSGGKSTGGGWLSKLFGIVAGAVIGGGGTSGPSAATNTGLGSLTRGGLNLFGGRRAGGGDVRPGYFYEVNEQGREFIAPTVPLRVSNQQPAGGGATYVINVSVPRERGGYTQPKSRRDLAADIVAALGPR